MQKSYIKYFIILSISLLVVFLSVQQTVLIQNKESLENVVCGFPIGFLSSDQSWRDPPYPSKAKCLGGEWGDGVDVQWFIFFLDIIIIYISIFIGLSISNGFFKNTKVG